MYTRAPFSFSPAMLFDQLLHSILPQQNRVSSTLTVLLQTPPLHCPCTLRRNVSSQTPRCSILNPHVGVGVLQQNRVPLHFACSIAYSPATLSGHTPPRRGSRKPHCSILNANVGVYYSQNRDSNVHVSTPPFYPPTMLCYQKN